MDKQIRKNMIWNAAGSIVYLAAQWVVTVLTTRFYGYADAGILSLAMSITSTFQTIALFGIRNFQVSDIDNRYPDNCYVMLRNITSVFAFALCVVFSLVNGYDQAQILSIIGFMLFRLAEDYSDVIYGISQKNGRLDLAGKGFMIKGVLTLGVFSASYYLGAGLVPCIFAMAAASWLSTILFDLLISKRLFSFSLTDSAKNCLSLGRETWPLCVYLFLSAAVTVIPKYILEKMTDETTLGAYSSIFAPAVIIHAAAVYIYTPFVNRFAELFSQKKYREFLKMVGRISLSVLALGAFAIVAAVFLGDFALRIMYGESILQYSDMLVPTLMATITIAIASFMYMLEVVIRDFKNLIIGCVIGCVFSTILTPAMINLFGANGTSVGMIISELISCGYMFLTMLKKLRRSAE